MSKNDWNLRIKAERNGSFFVEIEVSDSGVPMGGIGWPMSRATAEEFAARFSAAVEHRKAGGLDSRQGQSDA